MVLLSTVVAPAFAAGTLHLSPVQITPDLLAEVRRNLCGHPVTDAVLRAAYPALPVSERAFWDGSDLGLAIRPRGGVRGGAELEVTLADLEAVLVAWRPA